MKRLLLLLIIGFLLIDTSGYSQTSHVVISEVYGGGGNSGATYKNDFIELYNPTSSAVDLTGWTVQYISATGTGTWQKTSLSGSIGPKGYYLVQEAVGTGGTVNLPTPDAIGTIAMAAAAGKVALVSNSTALSGASPSAPSIVDLIGFGTANFFEGSAAAPAPSNTNSIERKANASSTSSTMQSGGADQYSGNGYDSNSNNTDFVTRSPEPQNSATAAEPDTTPPVFTASYPQSSNILSTSFDLVVNLNEIGKTYFVVLADGATAPSAVQVKAGQDALGNPIANSGSISVSAAGSNFSKTISGLLSSTNYDVYVLAEDVVLNLQTGAVLLDVTTNFAPSITPAISSLYFSGFTEKSKQSGSSSYTVSGTNLVADVNVSVSGNFLISSDNNTFSTSITIVAANFSSPQTVYVKFNPSGNLGTQTGAITHTSTGALDQMVSLSATAIDPFNQNFNDPNFLSTTGWTQYSVTGAQVWGSTNFGHTCLTGCNNSNVDKAVQINGYASGSQNNEDWLISPQLDLTTFANYPSLSFATISAFAGDVLQLKYSTDYLGSGDPTLATWTSIDGKFPASNSSTWTASSTIILPKNSIYVAFVYTSNTTAASRWTLDDWKVEDVPSYLNLPSINFLFGEVVTSNTSLSQNFNLTANGYGDITVSVPSGFEVSLDNSIFSSSVMVLQADASAGQTIYLRFAPISKQLKWSGSVNFSGIGLSTSSGSLSGSSYPKAETLNIATYNLEFFGTDVKSASNVEFGPTNDALQVSNVTTVLQTIGADIIGVEEISDDDAFGQLVSNLNGYDKVVSDRWSYSWQAADPNFPPQKTGFIYNTSKVQLVSARVLFASMYDSILAGTKTLPSYPTGTSSSFWSSGRLPFMAVFDVTINEVSRRIHVIDVHGKSASDQSSYNRRVYDARVLRDTLNAYYPHDNIILLGDFNDQVYGSITNGEVSSYQMFVDDTENFKAITYDLNVSGASTFPNSSSFIDNIVVSNELINALVNNSVTVEDPRGYISNYVATTSDHLPVSARFLLSAKADQTISFAALASKTFGDANFSLVASASSGLQVSYTSSDPNVVLLNGNVARILKAGTISITASQSGSNDFKEALPVEQLLTINKANQVITFNAMGSKTFGDASFTLTAFASSGLDIGYSTSDPSVASINGNVVTILKAGSVSISASQSGDDNYNAADDSSQSLTIKKASQSITFNSLAAKTLDENSFTVAATSTSGLDVTFSSLSDKIAINGTQVTLIKSGRTVIRAKQEGNENYDSAKFVDRSFCINPVTPIVSIDNSNPIAVLLTSNAALGNQWYLNGNAIDATAVNFTATTSGVYKVQTHTDDCYSDFSIDADIFITGVKEFTPEVSVYPNPVDEYLVISGIEESTTLSVVDFTGRTSSIAKEKFSDDYRVHVREFSSGLYILKITGSSSIHSVKFIKK